MTAVRLRLIFSHHLTSFILIPHDRSFHVAENDHGGRWDKRQARNNVLCVYVVDAFGSASNQINPSIQSILKGEQHESERLLLAY
jgi:hypothetical protein